MPINIREFISAFTDVILGSKVYQVAGSMQAIGAALTTTGCKSPYWNLVLDTYNPSKLVTDAINLVKSASDSTWTSLNTGGVINGLVNGIDTSLKPGGTIYLPILGTNTTLAVGGTIYGFVSSLYTLFNSGEGKSMIDKIIALLNISTAKIQHLCAILSNPTDAMKTNLYRLVEYFLNSYTEEPS